MTHNATMGLIRALVLIYLWLRGRLSRKPNLRRSAKATQPRLSTKAVEADLRAQIKPNVPFEQYAVSLPTLVTSATVKRVIEKYCHLDVSSVERRADDLVLVTCPFDLALQFDTPVEETTARGFIARDLVIPPENITIRGHQIELHGLLLDGSDFRFGDSA